MAEIQEIKEKHEFGIEKSLKILKELGYTVISTTTHEVPKEPNLIVMELLSPGAIIPHIAHFKVTFPSRDNYVGVSLRRIELLNKFYPHFEKRIYWYAYAEDDGKRGLESLRSLSIENGSLYYINSDEYSKKIIGVGETVNVYYTDYLVNRIYSPSKIEPKVIVKPTQSQKIEENIEPEGWKVKRWHNVSNFMAMKADKKQSKSKLIPAEYETEYQKLYKYRENIKEYIKPITYHQSIACMMYLAGYFVTKQNKIEKGKYSNDTIAEIHKQFVATHKDLSMFTPAHNFTINDLHTTAKIVFGIVNYCRKNGKYCFMFKRKSYKKDELFELKVESTVTVDKTRREVNVTIPFADIVKKSI